MINDEPILIQGLPTLKQIAAGLDHVLFLSADGEVFAMGDDTFGQCGTGGEGRAMAAPFYEARQGKPARVEFPVDRELKRQPKITKVVCGYRHNLAITEHGHVYGWGYNNQQQLSYSTEYQDVDNPMHAIFTPLRIGGPLTDLFVVNAAAGEEISFFVGHGKKAGLVFEQVYACGNNLKGTLGINRTSHLMDLTLVPDISDLFDEKDEPLMLNNLVCGRRHCLALFDYGAFMFWGENHVGQLGNRKRAFLESPYPSRKFE